MSNVWPPERVEALKRMREQHMSYGVIAERLGISRSAAIGKGQRLGLGTNTESTGVKAPPGMTLVRKSAAGRLGAKLARRNPNTQFGKGNPKPPQPPKPVPLPKAEDVARKTLLQLTRRDCKWPVGDPGTAGFGFCALEREPGKPYCAGHNARAVVSVRNT